VTGRARRLGFQLAMAIGAAWMVVFFNDPRPQVALLAFSAWCCFLVAIWKTGRP